MSLINKVLQDLESRREAPGADNTQPVTSDLHPVMGAQPRTHRKIWLTAGLLMGGVLAGSLYAWDRWTTTAAPMEAVVTVPVRHAQMPAGKPGRLVERPASAAPLPVQRSAPKTVAPLPPAPESESQVERVAAVMEHPVVATVLSALAAVTPSTAEARTPARPPAAKAAQEQPPVSKPSKPAARTTVKTAKVEKSVSPAVRSKPAEAVRAVVALPKPAPPARQSTSARRQKEMQAAGARKNSPVKMEDNEGAGRMEKTARPMTPAERAENAYRDATRKFRQRRTAEAERDLRLALANDPAHIEARELLAGLLLRKGSRYDAQELLEQGLEAVPAHVSFTLLLARIYVDFGAELKALALLEGNSRGAGASADYQAFLATLYQRFGRHDQAARAFSQALALRPTEGRWWLGLGISLEVLKEWSAARNAYQRATNSGSLNGNLQPYAERRLALIRNKK